MSTQTLDPHLLATLDPEERAAFEQDDTDPADVDALKAVAGGADDEGDDEDDDEADVGGEGSGNAAPIEGKGAKSDDDTPKSAATDDDDGEADDEPAPAPSPYRAELPENYDAQLQALKDEDAELRRKFKAGDIDIDERDEALAALSERREALLVARTKAEISGDMTRQSAQQSWQNEIKTFMAKVAKDEGIDYRKDQELNKALDKSVKLLANDPDNNDKPMAWFLTEAHRYVKFQRGLDVKPAPTPAPAPADAKKDALAKRKPDLSQVPKSLAEAPGGDGPGDVSGEFAHLDSLGGEDLESAIAKMTPSQRERYLRGE